MKHENFVLRKDYQKTLLDLCDALKPYYSDDYAYLNLGESGAIYDNRTIGLEAFSRPLWGLIPFFAGGGTSEYLNRIQIGIKNGINPEINSYWGDCNDNHQAFVEMAVYGLGLLLIPDKLWEPLNAKEKEWFNRWLVQINEYALPKNNWYFFRILVNAGLKKVGASYNQQLMDDALGHIESYYLGDGWYSDGKTLQRDYYISFAIHFYSLIYAKTMKDIDSKKSTVMIQRAQLFAQDFIYWFAEEGEALPYGRSLTYRFAQCAFWSALAFADVEVFSWGVIKGIINRHFRSWFQKPILDKAGILTIGYGYPNLNMAEGYNAPGSPYWSFKSFLILALPENHPFWKADEEPLPELNAIRVMKHPGMIVTRTEYNHVVALTSGQYPGFDPVHAAEKYAKFAYSTYFGFQVPRSYHRLEQAAPDNMLAFYKDDLYHVRRRCKEVIIENESIYSNWSPMEGIVVETRLQPWGNGHFRIHLIHAEYDCKAVECGFALPTDNHKDIEKKCTSDKIIISNDFGSSMIELLEGEGQPNEILCEANTNLLYNRTTMPYIQLNIKKGITKIKVFVVGTMEKVKGAVEK